MCRCRDVAMPDEYGNGSDGPPTSEFVGALNLPNHAALCHRQHNASRVILMLAMTCSSWVENATRTNGNSLNRGTHESSALLFDAKATTVAALKRRLRNR